MALYLLLAVILVDIGQARAGDFPDLQNFHRYDENTYSSGQPKGGDFAALANAGVQVIVNLSPAKLRSSLKNEKDLVEAQGMAYHYIPFGWEDPSLDEVEQFFAAMDSHEGSKILVHCWVNARASAAMYIYRVAKLNKPEDTESAALYSIWENNQGYELENVPHWQKFIKSAVQSSQ